MQTQTKMNHMRCKLGSLGKYIQLFWLLLLVTVIFLALLLKSTITITTTFSSKDVLQYGSKFTQFKLGQDWLSGHSRVEPGQSGRISRTLSASNLPDDQSTWTSMSSGFGGNLVAQQESPAPRILLVTYFRSGSSFLGDLLQQNPRTFYSFEPLHYMLDARRLQVNSLDSLGHLTEALYVINNLLSCSFHSIMHYIKWALLPTHRFLFKWNTFLWSRCYLGSKSNLKYSHQRICFNPSFLKHTCLDASAHVIKLTRLNLNHISHLLNATQNGIINTNSNSITQMKSSSSNSIIGNLNINFNSNDPHQQTQQQINTHSSVKIVLLVRDPRGIYSSRKNLSWCSNSPFCSNVTILCSEMLNDYYEYLRVKILHPQSIFLLKYEDLSFNIYNESSKLFANLNLPWSSEMVKSFIQTHTPPINETLNPYSTNRNSKLTASNWINKLTSEEINYIENSCSSILNLLGYKPVNTLLSDMVNNNFNSDSIDHQLAHSQVLNVTKDTKNNVKSELPLV